MIDFENAANGKSRIVFAETIGHMKHT
jgi:hypothetical protein